ncbi:AsmA2 domain-containing protein YhdP [Serratia sp. UGAL515B_01]|uniref:AsmA2 domain-containing protein YhdP n=1 Tax=Serratia sp. UGAL515B_01 TaxID=2986763 RepID=UPI0029559205|nr:AsmA2 domain-containing protein YhdP [Serratia sp. UGAL515B_01]WON76588.1 AsmA2 domain-containing protein YhdP [Serratia sp. UGAL515B_01]
MRRLPGILLATGAILIVVVALLISGLRLVLPELNHFRPQILVQLQAISGVPVDADFVQGSWETFGPTLEVHNIHLTLPQSSMKIARVTLALDVWQSLLHLRWQFRDLTFHQFQLDLNTTLGGSENNGNTITPSSVSDLFLYQLGRFDLRNSRVSFLTPSGARAEFHIPQMTWLNSHNRHRAEGQLSLSTLNGQHGVVQLRLDLRDEQGLLNTGTVYMQADNIDMKPWFSRWLRINTGLESADFSLSAWLNIQNGEIYGANALLKQGVASWSSSNEQHNLAVDNLALALERVGNGWQVNVPQLNLKTDGQAWAPGTFIALWLPENTGFMGPNQNEELRIRAVGIQLERLEALLPTFSFLSPNILERWKDLQPQGNLKALALDIPLKQPEKTRFQAFWQDLSWQHWQFLPGINHFSGTLSGSVENGRLTLGLNNSTMPYGDMFRAPLQINSAKGALSWQYNANGWQIASKGLDVKAKSLWVNGDFRYQQPANGEPWLDILAGIRLFDGADAWRYFPEPLMGKHLVDYLTGAIQGGQADNATLIYAGNPRHFPYKENDGQFQVYVPLRHATFQFQPDWPALNDLAIDLDFANNGLQMNAPQAYLGKVAGRNIAAVIPDYLKEKLFVDAEVTGDGQDIHDYFKQTPLDDSVGSALGELQVGGSVSGRLHLEIPLNGEKVLAKGEVTLNNNALRINPLGSQLERVSGKFRFNNGNLEGDTLTAHWFGQPLVIHFDTLEDKQRYQVNIGLKGNWQPASIEGIPPDIAKTLDGSVAWQGQAAIDLPHKGNPSYDIGINADLKKVNSHLPAPLDKKAGEALAVGVKVKGGLHGFVLNGSVGEQNHFNSEWLLAKQQVTLTRGVWQTGSNRLPELPKDESLSLNLPALNGEQWLALLKTAMKPEGSTGKVKGFNFPTSVALSTPQLIVGGQAWHKLQLVVEQRVAGTTVTAKGKEIEGSLSMPNNGLWRLDLGYLYYNPQFSDDKNNKEATNSLAKTENVSFHEWPSLTLRCTSCWLMGQNLGKVEADVKHRGDSLVLEHALLDTGYGRVNATGQWKQNGHEERSSLKGKLQGKQIDQTARFFGVIIPLKDAPYDIDFDMNWHGQPWAPQIDTLNGTMKINLGKGEVDDIGGRAGQILRLVSFDALLRKLRFDFRNTFGNGLYFDSIRGIVQAKDGIMRTDNLLIDGLSADIAMSGQIDLVRRQIDMQAVIAPEISATVGVATAFVINPIVGAAVFAASRVLSPLWNKISFIRYNITGSLDKPTVNEVSRKPKEDKAP